MYIHEKAMEKAKRRTPQRSTLRHLFVHQTCIPSNVGQQKQSRRSEHDANAPRHEKAAGAISDLVLLAWSSTPSVRLEP